VKAWGLSYTSAVYCTLWEVTIYSYTMCLDKTDWRSLWYTSAYSLNTWRLGVSLPRQYLLCSSWKLL